MLNLSQKMMMMMESPVGMTYMSSGPVLFVCIRVCSDPCGASLPADVANEVAWG